MKGEILRNEAITKDICRLTISAPEIATSALPGQFLMVKSSDKNNPLLRRPFSIHQTTSADRIQILFKKIGKGTRFLANKKQGDELDIIGPLGKGFSIPDKPTNICLVGGGMGVAPLFFLAKRLSRQSELFPEIKVLLGAAKAVDLTIISKDFETLGIKPVCATDDGSIGYHGLVTDLLLTELDTSKKWSVFTCGPHPMMHTVVKHSTSSAWSCQVSLETLMACGISACLGCAVKSSGNNDRQYLHVCKDGPVFDSGAISWK
ncbi:MAG: dihydroorotate dehydrogenase electron transfer subunit [Proteobacteria bacterium]|nr:dihydroorotate dehydrogenase electron transfer subunit [Pseudomonadota bacterium]MBU1737493.1 dihydroorotate dehydrogenase electron transfer subunit [Pseudomonadota bacterium]